MESLNYRLGRFTAPIRTVTNLFVPECRSQLIRTTAIGTAASILNLLGLLALAPVISQVLKDDGGFALGPFELEATFSLYASILVFTVVCITAALQLNYVVHNRAMGILKQVATRSAVIGLRKLASLSGNIRPRMAVREIVNSSAYACGFVMHQLALGLAELLQLAVYLLALLWLFPLITLVFAVLMIISVMLFASSLDNVIRSVSDHKSLAGNSREQLDVLSDALEADCLTEEELGSVVNHLYDQGAAGRMMETRLGVRREMKRGPLMIEFLYPVALVVVPLLALSTGTLIDQAGMIVIYILLLRNAIGVLQRLGSLVISVSRHHPPLQCFSDLIKNSDHPDCQFMKQPVGYRRVE